VIGRIILFTTTRCDLRCVHCLQGLPDKRADIPVDLVAQILEEARPFGAGHVVLTGGESRLHPEFDRLVDTIVEAGYVWSFISNGQQALSYVRAAIRHREAFDHATLSIDGATAEVHDALRNRPGAFERLLAVAEHYVRLGFKLRLQSCLSQPNKHQLEDIARLAADLGAVMYRAGGIIPSEGTEALNLSDEERDDLYTRLMALKDELDLDIRAPSALRAGRGVDFCDVLALHSLTFNARGEMIFCCDVDRPGAVIGSPAETPLPDLIKARLDMTARLKKRRVEMIAAGETMPGFNTCLFCNAYFANAG
jgi:MoaA/NifB/PqqE/SkfB family radical SAM enzyme